jgi:hypothetical protein
MTYTPSAILCITLSDGTRVNFTQGFTIGRHADCEIRIQDGVVSRRHAGCFGKTGNWWIQDRKSANGVFIDGQRIDRATLFGTGRIQLGAGGPTLFFQCGSARTGTRYRPPTPPPQAGWKPLRAPYLPTIHPASTATRTTISARHWTRGRPASTP